MKTLLPHALVIVVLQLLVSSPSVLAVDEALENVVVTASRVPVPLKAVGGSITVIGAEELENRQPNFIGDVLQSVPGVDVSRSGGVGGFTQLRVRGAEANQLLVLIDGVEVNDATLGSEFDFAHLLNGEIERIEVLRGAQSGIWGADALAGVINVISKEGSGPPRVHGFAEAGSFGTVASGGSVSGGGDRYHFSLHGRYINSDGINNAQTGDEEDGYENGSVSFRGGYRPHELVEFSGYVRHVASEREFDPAPFPVSVPVDGDRITDAEQTYARLQTSVELFDGRWLHRLGASLTDTENANIFDGVEDTSNAGRKFRLDYQTSIHIDTPGFADAEHTLTFAMDREIEDFLQRGTPSLFGDPNQDQSVASHGYAVEYRVALWGRLFLSGAVRRDDNNDFANSTTGRGTAAYTHLQTDTKVHFSYGTGVKNPTFTERFGFTPDTFIGNAGLSPEQSEGWEVGIRQALFDARLIVSAVYFDEELQNEINGFVFDPTIPPFGGLTAANIDGISERTGFELGFTAELLDSLDFAASYTNLDATQQNALGNQVREIRRPEDVASFNLNYRFLDDRANVNINVDHTGDILDTDFSTFTPVILDSFTLLDVSARYQLSNRVGVYARVENLLDDDYQEVFGFNTSGIAAFAGIKVTLDMP